MSIHQPGLKPFPAPAQTVLPVFHSVTFAATDPPEWVPDEACGVCTSCKAPFTVIRRKHHCRSCGKVGGALPALCIFGVVWGLSPGIASRFRR